MGKVEKLLDEQIIRLILELDALEPETDEYEKVTAHLNKLLERRSANKEINTNGFWNGVKTVVDLLGVGASTWLTATIVRRGFEFEKTGVYTSRTFSNFLSKIRLK